MSDRYIIGKQYCEGFADAIRPVAIDESKGPHWMAGYNDGYRFRSNKNELLNQYMAKIGRKPFGIIRLAATETDVIGGFPYADPNCKGCGKALAVENAWMTDGCPCNTPLGVNSMNETRWRLLMQLQQEQSREIARLRADVERKDEALRAVRAELVWWGQTYQDVASVNVLQTNLRMIAVVDSAMEPLADTADKPNEGG